MCNLNILIKNEKFSKREKELKECLAFLNSCTSVSFISNKDGDGVYFDSGLLVKGINKINFLDFCKEVYKSKFIISHQRLATS